MKLLIWDFDGTLGFREGHWTGALLEVLDRHFPGHGASREQLRPFLQKGFPWQDWQTPLAVAESDAAWWARLEPIFHRAFLDVVDMPEEKARQMAREVSLYYSNASCFRLYEDSMPAIKRLTALGWNHVILTNHVPEFERIIESLGIASHFIRSFNSSRIGFDKPHPQAFQMVREVFPQADTIIMVGDNPKADIAGAERAGIPALLLRRDSGNRPLDDLETRLIALLGRI